MKPSHLSWSEYIYRGLAGRMIRYGEKHGHNWLVYNPLVMIEYHRFARRDAGPFIKSIKEVFPEVKSVLDIGAGTCRYAAEGKKSGLDTLALEHNRFGRLMGKLQGATVRPFDLSKPEDLARRPTADLSYSLEVAEHLPEQLGHKLVEYMTTTAPILIFTAAPPGQEGTGHINLQPKTYWLELFAVRGYQMDESLVGRMLAAFDRHGVQAPWLISNLMVFRGIPVIPSSP